MRVLCVILPGSPHSVRHLNVLADHGWEVHAAILSADPLRPGYHPAITMHRFRLAQAALVSPAAKHDRALRRLDLTAQRFLGPRAANRLHAAHWRARLPTAPAVGLDAGLSRTGAYEELVDRLTPGVYDAAAAVWLGRLVDDLTPDVLHSFTLDQTGITTLVARSLTRKPFPPWIVSNWGMDIQFAGQLPEMRTAMELLLAKCDVYTAECHRDVEYARMLGFAGSVTDVLPIGGGFDLAELLPLRDGGPTSRRRLIMVKGYQGAVGRGAVALRALHLAAPHLMNFEIVMYACHPDLAPAAEILAVETGLAVTVLPHLPYAELMRCHGRSRLGLGLSIADGISTSALETMVMGAFPIQSNTSCLDEWIEDGQTGLLVEPEDPHHVAAALIRAVADDRLVDTAVTINDRLLEERLDAEKLRTKIRRMYEACVFTEGQILP